jgi:septal ring factor EnvC (AmiA/AmiB activator)
VITQPSNEYAKKQQELNKNLSEQVANHASMIEELNKSISSISSDIQSLQIQSAGLDKALSKLADNQANLLSMSAGKPHASPMVGMNSIAVSKIAPSTFQETYNELLNYDDLLEPLLEHFESMGIEE